MNGLRVSNRQVNMTGTLNNTLVIVTGVSYKEAKRIFNKGETSECIKINGVNHKINIGASSAKYLAQKGIKVCMVSRSEDKLHNLKNYICEQTNCDPDNVMYHASDLLDDNSVKKLIDSLPKKQPLWLVHSVGLSSHDYNVSGDNPYKPFTEMSPDMVTQEFRVPVVSLLLLMKRLEPTIKHQMETRIVVVSSMSGIRPFMYGYSHASAKAGLHHAVRSLNLELSQRYESVYMTEILPGIVDTGMYDSPQVINAVQAIAKTFGCHNREVFKNNNLPLMPPSAVAQAVFVALESEAHILSVNMVSRGQFPNMGG